VAAVQAGLGIAQLATWVVEQALREGRLVAILPAHVTQGLPLHIVWQRSREHSAKVRAVVGHFERTLGIGAMIDI
jgi:DNA-binding transcriptional LysR family regulator